MAPQGGIDLRRRHGAAAPVAEVSGDLTSSAVVCILLQEGIVPGGGAALLHLSEYVPEFKETLTDPEERLGADIISKALT